MSLISKMILKGKIAKKLSSKQLYNLIRKLKPEEAQKFLDENQQVIQLIIKNTKDQQCINNNYLYFLIQKNYIDSNLLFNVEYLDKINEYGFNDDFFYMTIAQNDNILDYYIKKYINENNIQALSKTINTTYKDIYIEEIPDNIKSSLSRAIKTYIENNFATNKENAIDQLFLYLERIDNEELINLQTSNIIKYTRELYNKSYSKNEKDDYNKGIKQLLDYMEKNQEMQNETLIRILFEEYNYVINTNTPNWLKNNNELNFKALNIGIDVNKLKFQFDQLTPEEIYIIVNKNINNYNPRQDEAKEILRIYLKENKIEEGKKFIERYITSENFNKNMDDELCDLIFNTFKLDWHYFLDLDLEIIAKYFERNMDNPSFNPYIINVTKRFDPNREQIIDRESLIKFAFKKGYQINSKSRIDILEYTDECQNYLLTKYQNERLMEIGKEMFGHYGALAKVISAFAAYTKTDEKDAANILINNFFNLEKSYNIFHIIQLTLFGQNKYTWYYLCDLIKNNTYKIFKDMMEKMNIPLLFIGKYFEYINTFHKYENLFKEAYNKIDELSKLDTLKLKAILNNNYSEKEIVSLSEIKNLEQPPLIDDKSFTYILNHININSLKDLQSTIKNEKLKILIDDYIRIIKFLDIFNLSNYNDKKKILNKIEKSPEIAFKLNSLLSNMVENIKKLYGEEANEKLTNFAQLLNQDESEIKKDNKTGEPLVIRKKIKVPNDINFNSKRTGNKKIKKGTTVDLIELNGTPFVTYAHVLNAFSSSGFRVNNFDAYLKPLLSGNNNLCLSAIDDCHFIVARNNENSIVLLYDYLPSENLEITSTEDIASRSGINGTTIESKNTNYTLQNIRYIVSHTDNDPERLYNEVDYYRNGTTKPSAILIPGDEPTKEQIQIAAYLQIPLVKINKEKYTNYSLATDTRKMAEKDKELSQYYETNSNINENVEYAVDKHKEFEEVSDSIYNETGRRI